MIPENIDSVTHEWKLHDFLSIYFWQFFSHKEINTGDNIHEKGILQKWQPQGIKPHVFHY